MTSNRSIMRTHGVRVVVSPMQRVTASETKGVSDATAITFARTGAKALSGCAVHLEPGVTNVPHHHGEAETAMIVLHGNVRLRWGEELQFASDGAPGDFIFVPPYVPHQEINLSEDEPLEMAVIHTGQQEVQVDLDIEPSAEFEMVSWDDPDQAIMRKAMLHGLAFGR